MTGSRTDLFRTAAGRFPTGVTVLTTLADGEPFGMTANAFMSLSLDPLLVAVGLGTRSRAHGYVRGSGRFAVTVLSDRQTGTARRFADPARPVGADAFAADDWKRGPATGCPVLLDGVGYFDCTVHSVHTAGDHTLVVGRVDDFGPLAGVRPLVFVDSAFAATDPTLLSNGPFGART
ncbi:flavin reductase family protein [Streptomyces sp. NPDC058614]|uniref:flavin reductase family protein n=1 Tax=Streptomyces sp. NPDC058614 TaxID=3346557 RepID=UPI00364C8E4E